MRNEPCHKRQDACIRPKLPEAYYWLREKLTRQILNLRDLLFWDRYFGCTFFIQHLDVGTYTHAISFPPTAFSHLMGKPATAAQSSEIDNSVVASCRFPGITNAGPST